jgi:hypothetical protein
MSILRKCQGFRISQEYLILLSNQTICVVPMPKLHPGFLNAIICQLPILETSQITAKPLIEPPVGGLTELFGYITPVFQALESTLQRISVQTLESFRDILVEWGDSTGESMYRNLGGMMDVPYIGRVIYRSLLVGRALFVRLGVFRLESSCLRRKLD